MTTKDTLKRRCYNGQHGVLIVTRDIDPDMGSEPLEPLKSPPGSLGCHHLYDSSGTKHN